MITISDYLRENKEKIIIPLIDNGYSLKKILTNLLGESYRIKEKFSNIEYSIFFHSIPLSKIVLYCGYRSKDPTRLYIDYLDDKGTVYLWQDTDEMVKFLKNL